MKIGLCGTLTSRKKKKGFFRSKSNTEHDKAELALYEEVTLMKPFRRKTLILIGASGSSRRALKHRIINGDPDQVNKHLFKLNSMQQDSISESGQLPLYNSKITPFEIREAIL